MIMQAYDFYALFQKYGCNMQFGGDDQWSNMLAGTELIRRKLGEDAGAMTITLLLNSEGKKMGKHSQVLYGLTQIKHRRLILSVLEKCCGCRRFEMYSYAYVPSA